MSSAVYVASMALNLTSDIAGIDVVAFVQRGVACSVIKSVANGDKRIGPRVRPIGRNPRNSTESIFAP
jgi:hypothetical protein